jgi:hypothetical protein
MSTGIPGVSERPPVPVPVKTHTPVKGTGNPKVHQAGSRVVRVHGSTLGFVLQ